MPNGDHTEIIVVWFNKLDITLNYVKTNNLHVMWSANVIDAFDDYDIINVVF
jgi:hypothetical protein